MAEPGVPSDAASKQTIERNIRAMKRKLQSNAAEIKLISETGKAALTDPDQVDSFKGMFRVLDRHYDKFENTWEEIIDIFEGEGKGKDFPTDRDTSLRDTVKSCYYSANTAFEKIKSQSACNMANVTISENKGTSPLYKIQVPRFNGTITEWPRFRDVFVSLVHNESSISDIQKFHYLVSALTDDASSVINNFKLVEENYNLAWKALCKAYENKRLLASTYLNRILEFSPLQGKTSIENLKSFRLQISDNIAAFKLMKIPNEADYILFHMGIRCLDSDSRKQFERENAHKDFPSFEVLNDFITKQITSFELSEANTVKTFKDKVREPCLKKSYPNKQAYKQSYNSALFSNTNKQSLSSLKCIICTKNSHYLSKCEEFLKLSVPERINLLNSKSWIGCRNCLSNSHATNKCYSKWSCKFCHRRHNSLLHNHDLNQTPIMSNPAPKENNEKPSTSLNSTSCHRNLVLLGTARAQIKDLTGRYHTVRLVIDSGSQNSFITSNVAKRLGLKCRRYQSPISGIGQTIFEGGMGKATVEIRPISSTKPVLTTEAIIIKNITSHLPQLTLPTSIISSFQHLPLADETFWEAAPIDFLLGADLYVDVITGPPVAINEHMPKYVPSIFGNIILGRFNSDRSESETCSFFTVNQEDDINESIKMFWRIEEIHTSSAYVSDEDRTCEEFFKASFRRNKSGRYIISLPWKTSPPDFDKHSNGPLRRYYSLEGRLNNAPDLKSRYVDFMREYLYLNHMSIASCPSKYIIPHHAVLKEDRNQSKIRVVFDASFKTKSGSLNSHLLVGPKLQQDIRTILQNFRIHPIVFVADIVKMYRQILIDEKDLPYQHIFWRFNDYEPVKKYELKTLVYGMSCAPFLAMRVLRQLVLDEGHKFPNASHVLLQDTYVDDIATGHETKEKAQFLKNELIGLLDLGGFKLDKWASNCSELLTEINSVRTEPISLQPKDDTFLKILGLQWMPKEDAFTYKITSINPKITKRSILSTVAKVYDPLGFISPTVLLMKSFIQELWKLKMDWDETIPKNLEEKWIEVTSQLIVLSSLHIPRHIAQNTKCLFKLIGFSDASSTGYCANIYIHSTSETNVQVKLLTSKTKLAPLKVLSTPRLELCGAVLLTKLYESLISFRESLKISDEDVHFFTDSSIVLAWIKTPSHQLNTFVGNRVAEITRLSQPRSWNHVRSEENPADIGSRGILPSQLINNKLWWNGPTWLTGKADEWPSSVISFEGTLPEVKKSTSLISTNLPSSIIEWTERFSSYNKIVHVVAWIRRFLHNSCNRNSRISGPLTLQEIKRAQLILIKAVQRYYFFQKRRKESNDFLQEINKLSPFIDDMGLVRVGGRLKNANISWNQKHPILLPKQCHFTRLLVAHLHRLYLHPGPNALRAFIQSTYWIPSIKRLINQITHKCLPCHRLRVKPFSPIMADLPSHRVTPSRPFSQTGIDFAGPFICRESLRRKSLTHKAYLALFICMSTKAIHLEAVTSLTTEAFIAALHRFISRRGLPSDIYSDNATNFTGTANYLKDLSKWLDNKVTQNAIIDFTNSLEIKWHFMPPHAPHFGGLWEAGVKSVKHHLRRTAGCTPLTYEELCTLFARIEAVLNSRPLTPLSNSPNENNFLSPGHFLIGGPIVTFPEASLMDEKINRLNRWQLIHRMTEELWRKWRLEYLATLQQRNKWNKRSDNPLVGDLVLLKEDNTPPLHWPRGRITELHCGRDGIARVASVRTSDKRFRRPLTKLVPLLQPSIFDSTTEQ